MYELQVALKYLIPKKKALSTALVSLMSVAVISLVVWLVLIFLSVTAGIEKNWLSKLTTLHAPLRISPTEDYYRSYYYQIDSIASASNYTLKTIGEKGESSITNPYAEETDVEIPFFWPQPEPLDLVKEALNQLEQAKRKFPGLCYQDYEIGGALLKLEIEREGRSTYLSQMSYLLSFSDQNPHLKDLLLPPTSEDLKNGPNYGVTFDQNQIILPQSEDVPVLLPKTYRDSRVLIGDRGSLLYSAPVSATSQEQRIPIRVAGFYDPGFLSIGNRCLIVPNNVTRAIYAAAQTSSPDGTPTNGFFIWPKDGDDVNTIRDELIFGLQKAGAGKYWKVDTFENFEFSKDLLNQFRSDRTLFTLIGGVILLVACCNIISLLVLLVNDKKREIAILQSMGASFKSIASIFAFCGLIMGFIASLCGIGLAILTLRNLDTIVSLLSSMQGRAAFNPTFFGQHLPNELSSTALTFILIATPILSLLAGLVPAIKASRIRPSNVLRSE